MASSWPFFVCRESCGFATNARSLAEAHVKTHVSGWTCDIVHFCPVTERDAALAELAQARANNDAHQLNMLLNTQSMSRQIDAIILAGGGGGEVLNLIADALARMTSS